MLLSQIRNGIIWFIALPATTTSSTDEKEAYDTDHKQNNRDPLSLRPIESKNIVTRIDSDGLDPESSEGTKNQVGKEQSTWSLKSASQHP